MSKEEDFQKVILDALAGLRKDIDGLKIDVTGSEKRVVECVDRVQKIVDGAEWEIEDLNEEIRKCKKCRLWKTRTNVLLYNNSLREDTINNYRKLKVLLMDCKWFPVCPMKRFYEEGKLDKKWIELYCKGDWESCVRYKMEERGELHPDWMLPDGSIDEELRNYTSRMVNYPALTDGVLGGRRDEGRLWCRTICCDEGNKMNLYKFLIIQNNKAT